MKTNYATTTKCELHQCKNCLAIIDIKKEKKELLEEILYKFDTMVYEDTGSSYDIFSFRKKQSELLQTQIAALSEKI